MRNASARAQLPMELASTRLAMARSLAERSPEVAIAEAKSALEGFERLEAARYADAAAQVLRSLGAPARTGPKGVGALTKREAEVCELIGAGLSNPEIEQPRGRGIETERYDVPSGRFRLAQLEDPAGNTVILSEATS